MDATDPLIVPLKDARALGNRRVGGKAEKLAALIACGYRVPRGICITTEAYRRFVTDSALNERIRMELGRKPLSSMRWEEVWDAALRIRTAFLQTPVAPDVAHEIAVSCRALSEQPLVVRSSAPDEDSAQRSYAGLHESVIGGSA
jgi:pyruvate,water dikinase